MNDKFDRVICNGVVYDRETILAAIRDWTAKNLILNYGIIRVVNETVHSDLFDLFNIKPHYPVEYRERGLNGNDFLANILLECGMQSGREEKELEMKKEFRVKEEKYLKLLEEKQNKIKELEEKLKKAETVSIKK